MTSMKVTAKFGPAPSEIVAAFKTGWSIARIVKESGLDRQLVETILRKYVQPGGQGSNRKGKA
jgi:lambda repressor-like predicted transcriptional regulator